MPKICYASCYGRFDFEESSPDVPAFVSPMDSACVCVCVLGDLLIFFRRLSHVQLRTVCRRTGVTILLGRGSLPPDFCQQMCEIPSPCFKAVLTGFLLQQMCEIPSPFV